MAGGIPITASFCVVVCNVRLSAVLKGAPHEVAGPPRGLDSSSCEMTMRGRVAWVQHWGVVAQANRLLCCEIDLASSPELQALRPPPLQLQTLRRCWDMPPRSHTAISHPSSLHSSPLSFLVGTFFLAYTGTITSIDLLDSTGSIDTPALRFLSLSLPRLRTRSTAKRRVSAGDTCSAIFPCRRIRNARPQYTHFTSSSSYDVR